MHCYCLAAVLLLPSGLVPGKTWPKTLHFQNARGFNILPHFYSVYSSTCDTAGLGHLLLSIISVQMITSRSLAGQIMLWKMFQCLEIMRVWMRRNILGSKLAKQSGIGFKDLPIPMIYLLQFLTKYHFSR